MLKNEFQPAMQALLTAYKALTQIELTSENSAQIQTLFENYTNSLNFFDDKELTPYQTEELARFKIAVMRQAKISGIKRFIESQNPSTPHGMAFCPNTITNPPVSSFSFAIQCLLDWRVQFFAALMLVGVAGVTVLSAVGIGAAFEATLACAGLGLCAVGAWSFFKPNTNRPMSENSSKLDNIQSYLA